MLIYDYTICEYEKYAVGRAKFLGLQTDGNFIHNIFNIFKPSRM